MRTFIALLLLIACPARGQDTALGNDPPTWSMEGIEWSMPETDGLRQQRAFGPAALERDRRVLYPELAELLPAGAWSRDY